MELRLEIKSGMQVKQKNPAVYPRCKVGIKLASEHGRLFLCNVCQSCRFTAILGQIKLGCLFPMGTVYSSLVCCIIPSSLLFGLS